MVFQKGVSGNPKGRPVEPYQPYKERAKYLLNQYDAQGIMELLGDKKRFGKLPVRDAMLVKQMGEAIAGQDARLEREALLDRLEGKAHQSVEVSGQISIVGLVLEASKQQEPIVIEQEANTKALEKHSTMHATAPNDTGQTSSVDACNEFKQPSDKQG